MEVDPKLKSAVIKLKSGNSEDFGEIYAKTYNYVYFRARQIMKNEEDALDLLQIVYMEAYKSIDSLEKVESIYSWLSSITFRQGMKLFHKNKEILLDEDFENIFDSLESSDRDSRPELSFEKKEQQRLLAEFIDSLPEVQRATVVAFYYDNIKIEEIAEVMDCSVGTVKSRLSYARQALKKKLQAAEKKGGAGKMALTGALIFGAVQVMSEETVLAAPVAAGAFGSICSGLGIAGTGAALAGTALAGGAGISAATGSTAGTAAVTALTGGSAAAGTTAGVMAAGTAAAGTAAAGTAAGATAAGTAAAGTAAAGTVAAAGTAAAGTAAAGTAAAGTAAAAAGTVVTNTVVAGGAAKGIAVAVAVAVAGTGGTVGTTIYRNSVSSSQKAAVSEDSSVNPEEEIAVDTVSEDVNAVEEDVLIPATEEETVPEETVSAPEAKEEELSGENDTENDKEPEAVSANASEKEDEKPVSGNEAASSEYKFAKKAGKHLSRAVASLFLAGNGNPFNGEVNDNMLEAAYLLENGNILSKKELKAISSNAVFLSNTEIRSARKEGEDIVVTGGFDAGRSDEAGNLTIDHFGFILKGREFSEKGVFGNFHTMNLVMAPEGSERIENPLSVSANEVPVSKPEDQNAETGTVPAPEETVPETPVSETPVSETPEGVIGSEAIEPAQTTVSEMGI